MTFGRALLQRTDLHARVRQLSSGIFVDYEVAEDIVAEVELLALIKSDEAQGRLIVAQSGNGKTAIAKRILRLFPATNDPDADAAKIPIVRVLMPGKSDRGMFARQVLRALGQTRKPSASANELLSSMYGVIKALGVETILLDEFQHMNAGTPTEKVALRNEVKMLGEQCNITVIGLGTTTALNVVNSQEQFWKRFEPRPLPLWQLNDELRTLVYHFERHMGLAKPSDLADNDPFLKHLLAQSEGTIGAMTQMIRRASSPCASGNR
jgi:hypothetical protein